MPYILGFAIGLFSLKVCDWSIPSEDLRLAYFLSRFVIGLLSQRDCVGLTSVKSIFDWLILSIACLGAGGERNYFM